MKRQKYHFPFPRRERLTQISLSDDDLMLTPFMGVDQSSVSAPVFYRRYLPKKVKLGEKLPEIKQLLVVEHEPEVIEKEPVVTEEIIKEKKPEELKSATEKSNPVNKLEMKKRDIKVKEIIPHLLISFGERREGLKEEEPAEVPTSYSRVSVVMAFRGRDDGRLEGLKKCIRSIREQTINCYIILIEQDKSPVHQDELEPLVDSYLFTYSSFLFNKSWAFNCGVMIAPDDLVLLHDCDLLLPKHYIKESIKILDTKDIALPWAKIAYLTEESSKQYPDCNPRVSYILTNHQAVGGSLLVRKKFYLRIGGMDERFKGWGAEDNAFYSKSIKLGKVNRANPVIGITLLHHYHKPALKSHANNHINNHIFWQYCQWSKKDIMERIEALGTIGNPLKMREEEEGVQVESTKVLRL
jgi:glycosyltransferase involved in cell wall biosynthesis